MTRLTQGDVDAEFFKPVGGGDTTPAIILLQEYWGLNENILAQAQRWANEGFAVIVPDLYHGKLAKDGAEANAWLEAFDWGQGFKEIAACIEWAKANPRSNGKIIVTGYCMGGALTLGTAVNVRGLAASISYYGYPGDLDWSKIDAPVQCHVALHDDWVKVPMIEKVKAGATNTTVEVFTYDAQHAFCNEKRPEVFSAENCKLAWDRTLAFAKQHGQ